MSSRAVSLGAASTEGLAGADYRLSRFVPLPENRLALVAAHRLLDGLATGASLAGLTPLFVYGPVGAGKSHLLHGLAQQLLEQQPHARLTLLHPAEPTAPNSVDGPRCLDVVLIEDLHRFRENSLLEEELARLLDASDLSGGVVLVSSQVLPARLAWLGSRTISRLQQGLVVCLPEPAVASRARLVLELAARRQLPLSPSAVEPLVHQLPASVRQLEAFVSLLQQTPEALARPGEVLKSLLGSESGAAAAQRRLSRLVEQVAQAFQVSARSIRGARRDRCVLLPRQVAMFLARSSIGLPLTRIGQYFSGRDHSTVLHACRKVQREAAADPALAGLLRELRFQLA